MTLKMIIRLIKFNFTKKLNLNDYPQFGLGLYQGFSKAAITSLSNSLSHKYLLLNL